MEIEREIRCLDIKAIRKECLGLTQEGFATLLGTYKSRVSEWENGLVSPNASSIKKIFSLLECWETKAFRVEAFKKIKKNKKSS